MTTRPGSPNDPAEVLFRRGFVGRRRRLERPRLAWDPDSPLNQLLSPIGPDAFFSNYFGRSFLHLKAENRDRLAHIFSSEALGRLFAYRHVPADALYLYGADGRQLDPREWLAPDGTPSLDRVVTAIFERRGSASIKRVCRIDAGVSTMAMQMTDWLHVPVTINAYLTLRSQKTLGWHWDGYDVFVLQVEGKKRWDIYEPLFDHPMVNAESALWSEVDRTRSKRRASLTLRRGDVLYLPAGFPHDVRALDDSDSLHLTVGLFAPRWHDVMTMAVEALMTESQQDVDFRRPAWGLVGQAPSAEDLRHFERLVGRVCTRLRASSLARVRAEMERREDRIAAEERVAQWAANARHASFTATSSFRRTRRAMRVYRRPGYVEVRSPTRVICLDPRTYRASHFISRTREFRFADLPGLTRGDEKRELIECFIEAGVIVTDGRASR